MPMIIQYVEHRLHLIVREAEGNYRAEWLAPDDRPLGEINFDRAQVDGWRAGLISDQAATLRDFSAVVLQPIADQTPDRLFVKSGETGAVEHQALLDIDLRVRGLADLPWEDLVDAQGRPLHDWPVLIRRYSPAFARTGGQPLSMPMRWTAVSAAVDVLRNQARDIFGNRSLEEMARGLLIFEAARLFEVSSEAGTISASELLIMGPAACAAIIDWTPDRLLRALDQWQARVVLMQPDPNERVVMARLAALADGLIDLGGPAVVIMRGGDLANFQYWFLDALIHDATIEWAVMHAVRHLPIDAWPRPWPDASYTVPGLAGPMPLVFGGGGRGDLVRPSIVLPAMQEFRDRLEHQVTVSQSFIFQKDVLGKIASELGLGPIIQDFTRESRGFLPLANEWDRLDRLWRQLNQLAGAGGPAEAGAYANLVFLRGLSPQTAHSVPKNEALVTDQLVHLRLNIGAQLPENLIINPSPFPKDAIDWSAPAVMSAGGVWLTVIVFTHDFEVAASDLHYLWLTQYGGSGYVYVPLIPHRAGRAELRLAVYYKDNLLQSFQVEAQVAGSAGSAINDRAQQRARIEYSTVTTLAAVDAVPERAATIIVNRDGNGQVRVQVKSGDLRDDLGLDKVPDFVTDLRGELDRICMIRAPDNSPLRYRYKERTPGVPSDQWNRGTDQQVSEALKALAALGWQLYETLFNGGTRRQLAQQLAGEGPPIHIARVVQGKVIPWTAIYDRPLDYAKPAELQVCLTALDPAVTSVSACGQAATCPLQAGTVPAAKVVCPWHFWGFRRIIEQPPQQIQDEQAGQPAGAARETRREVKRGDWFVGVNSNMNYVTDHVADLEHMAQTAGAHVAQCDDRAEVLQGLQADNLALIYFYCHGLDSPPRLAVGADESLNPSDLSLSDQYWSHAPLVFINGCHTLAFSPASLSPFISRFVDDHGAAGVVGTEISVWEDLAREVAESFFKQLLAGATAGEAMLTVRRDLLRKRNPLGLVYILFCDADLKLV